MRISFLEAAQQELDEAIEYTALKLLALGGHFLRKYLLRWNVFASILKVGILCPGNFAVAVCGDFLMG